MIRRAVLLADGPSDLPLANHIEQICLDGGWEVTIEPIDPRLLPNSVDRTVEGRFAFLVGQDIRFDVAFVHRDAEAQDPDHRRREIADAAVAAGVPCPVIPIVPVRMTEAWLLLDEEAIRHVAGRPSVKAQLDLPTVGEVERLSDPKQQLSEVLLAASGTSGRRRNQFIRDFGRHRGQLLARLDPAGPVSKLKAWQRMRADILSTFATLDRQV